MIREKPDNELLFQVNQLHLLAYSMRLLIDDGYCRLGKQRY